MKKDYFQTIRKRDFEENQKDFLTAGHLLFLRPFPAAGHIATVVSCQVAVVSVSHLSFFVSGSPHLKIVGTASAFIIGFIFKPKD